MSVTLNIESEELSDATKFKLFDKTAWDPEFKVNYSKVVKVLLTVNYNSTDYTLKLYDTSDATNLIGLDLTYINLFGTSCGSYYEVAPSSLKDVGGTELDDSFYTDGYYVITLDVTISENTWGGTIVGTGPNYLLSDEDQQGFIAHAECRATLAPLEIDLDSYDYQYNRTLFLLLAQLNAAKSAAELGRQSQFETIIDKIIDFLDANDIDKCW